MSLTSEDSRITMARIMSTVCLNRGHINHWPTILIWETDSGPLAVVEEAESLRFLVGSYWEVRPKYVQALIEGKYGRPTALHGLDAIRHLAAHYTTANKEQDNGIDQRET